MHWTLPLFAGLTGFFVWRHLRATGEDGASACPRCRASLPAGAQRCPECGVPVQVYEVVAAEEAAAEAPEDEGAVHAIVRADVCVGCAACVPVCPVDGAIRMRGKLAVVDLSLCVGHGHCAEACPVGAIHVGAGSARRVEVPRVGPDFQTNVPGLYVVGELGGRGLIKNAINEGKIAAECAVEALADDPVPDPSAGRVYDLAVVGSGPAGLSAALEAKRRGADYLVLEQGSLADTIRKYPRQKLLLAEPVTVPLYGDLWIADATKEALLETWQAIVDSTQLQVRTHHRVEGLQRLDDGTFELQVTDGARFRARRVILALGRRGTPRRLGVPGEELGKVLYDVVEMEAFAHARVLVVGGGDSALESAVGMANQPGADVILSYRGDSFPRAKSRNVEKLETAEREGRLRVLRRSHVRAIHEDRVEIEVDGSRVTEANDFVVIRIGGEAPYAFLQRIGVEIIHKDVPLVESGADV